MEAVEECDLPLAEYVDDLANQCLLAGLLHGILEPRLLLLLLALPPLQLLPHLPHLIIELLRLLLLPSFIILFLAEVFDDGVQGFLEVEELDEVELGVGGLRGAGVT